MPDTEFSRGRESGSTETRLEGHDDRLQAINGNIAGFVKEMGTINREMGDIKMLLQSVRDTVKAGAEAAINTAAALEKADAARRKKDEEAWTPITKFFAIIAAVSSVIAIYFAIIKH